MYPYDDDGYDDHDPESLIVLEETAHTGSVVIVATHRSFDLLERFLSPYYAPCAHVVTEL